MNNFKQWGDAFFILNIKKGAGRLDTDNPELDRLIGQDLEILRLKLFLTAQKLYGLASETRVTLLNNQN